MYPQKIALLTDSCADLTPRLAEENHVYIVPLRILCSDGEYSDGVDIRNTDIYARLQAGELPRPLCPAWRFLLRHCRRSSMTAMTA